MPYDERAAAHLAEQGLPHPPVRSGNRAPTQAELAALDTTGCHVELRATSVAIRAMSHEAELRFAYALVAVCGQQWIYPDSGAPSIVVDPHVDPARALRVWSDAHERPDGWEWLYRELYGG